MKQFRIKILHLFTSSESMLYNFMHEKKYIYTRNFILHGAKHDN